MSKGFGKKAEIILICEAAQIEMPKSKAKVTVYRPLKTKKKPIFLTDLDDLCHAYGLNIETIADLQIEIQLIKIVANHPEVELRKGISNDAMLKVVNAASENGSDRGKVFADSDLSALTQLGIKNMGIHDVVIVDGKIVPRARDGQIFKHLELDISPEWEVLISETADLHEQYDCHFYANLIGIVIRRIKSYNNNHKIAGYINSLIVGILERNPNLGEGQFPIALLRLIFQGCKFSENRQQLIWQLMETCPDFDHEHLMADLFASAEIDVKSYVVAPGREENLISKEDFRKLDPWWIGQVRFAEIADKLEEAERKAKEDNH